MMESVVIIDSSDDENEENVPPTKKLKTEQKNGFDNGEEPMSIKIIGVTSLAENNNEPEPEVIEIDDDDTTNNEGSTMVLKPVTEIVDFVNTNKNSESVHGSLQFKCGNIIVSTENGIVNGENVNNRIVSENEEIPSTSETQELSSEFKDFIESCVLCTRNVKHKEALENKIPKMKERYFQADANYIVSKAFIKMINTNRELIKLKPANAIFYFKQVYEELKSRKQINEELNLTDKQEIFLIRLKKALRVINKKIKTLEEAEVDWDDDNDSNYIQMQRYRQKFVDIHSKICTYTKENMHAGRITRRKLDFSASKFSEINRAIDKLYLKHYKFPLLEQVDACIRKCVKEKNLNLEGVALDLEIKQMFTEMGKLVQMRRKHELDTIHSEYLGATMDPAIDNPVLQSALDEQGKIGEQKMEAVFQSFTDRQLQGEEPEVSSEEEEVSEIDSETADEDV